MQKQKELERSYKSINLDKPEALYESLEKLDELLGVKKQAY